MGLTMKERKAVTKALAQRYRKASKKHKTVILDEFVALTGYNRSYASYLLNSHGKRIKVNKNIMLQADLTKKASRKRAKIYGDRVKKALVKIWTIMGFICGKRLAPIFAEIISKLEDCKELTLDKETRQKLLRISPATIDRLLREEKKKYELKGRSHTKPGTLLKSQIPIRTFSEWNEQRPGFLEVDLVGHEG